MLRVIIAGYVRRPCVLFLLLAFVMFPSTSLLSRNFKTLHEFTFTNGTNSDGGHPVSGLILISNTLYGTASDGG